MWIFRWDSWRKETRGFVGLCIKASIIEDIIDKGKLRQTSFWMFVWDFCAIRELFNYLETSPLTMKGITFWFVLGTHGHWTEQWMFLNVPNYCNTGCSRTVSLGAEKTLPFASSTTCGSVERRSIFSVRQMQIWNICQ